MRKNTYEGVCACAVVIPCEHPLTGHYAILFSPFNACSFEFQVIGVEDSPTTRSGGRLFCYHVSSQTDVNLRKGERERERERERGRESGGERGGMKEKWRDGVQWRGLKGEERIRSVRAALRTPLAAPSLS